MSERKQVETVKRMLFDIGIQSKLTKPGFVVDLLGPRVAVEVTSDTGKIKAKSDSLTQLGRFTQEKGTQKKMILVANTYKRLPVEDRAGKEDFSPQAAEYLKRLGVCHMSARCLYLLWKKVKEEMYHWGK